MSTNGLSWCDFASEVLDEQEDEPTLPGCASAIDGLVELTSEVRIRAAERAETIARRGSR